MAARSIALGLQAAGGNTGSYSMHPGWAETGGARDAMGGLYDKMEGRIRTPEQVPPFHGSLLGNTLPDVRSCSALTFMGIEQASAVSQFYFDVTSCPNMILGTRALILFFAV